MSTPHVQLPGYQVVDLLGRGGFGLVYRAVQVAVDREVAVKVDSRVVLDERDRRRFLREAKAAGRLSGHPHVVDLYDAGVLGDGRPYLVMELCTGGSLAGRLGQTGPMRPAEVLELGAKLADALVAAHDVGVLHRDIKPANILINRYGVPGLTDFGLAVLADSGRHATTTLAALTPAYAAPEAFRQEQPTERTDIYSLGATLYALLAGRPPRFPATGEPSLPEILQLHHEPIPELPGVPAQVSNVLSRAMATDPDRRYRDAADFRDALAALTVDPTVPAIDPATVALRFGPRRDEPTTLGRVGQPGPLVDLRNPSAPPPGHPAAALGPAPASASAGRGRLTKRVLIVVAALMLAAALVATTWVVATQRSDSEQAPPDQPAGSGADPASSPPAEDVSVFGRPADRHRR